MKVDLLRQPGLQLDGPARATWSARVAEAFSARRLTVLTGTESKVFELDARAIAAGLGDAWPSWIRELLDDVASSPQLRDLTIDARVGSDLAAVYEAPRAIAHTIRLPVDRGMTTFLLHPPAALFAAAQRSESSIDEPRGGAFTRTLAKALARESIEGALEQASKGSFAENSYRASGSRPLEKIPPTATRALLIGNSRYAADDTLPGAREDVRTLAAALGRKGVPVVRRAFDLSARAIERQAVQLLETTPRGQRAMLYFSGHGVDGEWVGVGGDQLSLHVGSFAAALERARQRGVSVVIVTDACESGAAVDQALERRATRAADEGEIRTLFGAGTADSAAPPIVAAAMRAKTLLEQTALRYADTLLDLDRTEADIADAKEALDETLAEQRSVLKLPPGALGELSRAFAVVREARGKLAHLRDDSSAAQEVQEDAREAVEQWLGQYGRALVEGVRRTLDDVPP